MKVLIQELKQFYIPPLSKLYFERIALEKLVFHAPLFVRISDPESWRVKDEYQKLKNLSKVALKCRMENLKAYLTLEQGGSIFEGHRVLTLNESIPYIEWQSQKGLLSSGDLLGKYSLFIDLWEFESELETLAQMLLALQEAFEDVLQVVLIGSHELTVAVQESQNVICIDTDKTTHLSFVERFKFRNKNGLTLFNFASRPYFLISPQGQLMTFFTKQDQQNLMDEIKKYI